MDSNLIISASKFLLIYHNIEGEGLNKLTHEQINEMFGASTVPFETVLTEDILTGKIILVKDGEGKIMCYENPLLVKEDFEEKISSLIITFDKDPVIDIRNINDYSDYELTELIKDCKKTKNDKDKNTIIKELNKREGKEKHSKERALEKVRKREIRKER